MITDFNAKTVYVEYLLDATGQKTTLVVETRLQLDQAEPDYEPDKVQALCDNLNRHREQNSYIDLIRLIRRI
ncbi:hypothetical protein V1282_003524 [Nitrobacteraceae bacterium AZCC 2146]